MQISVDFIHDACDWWQRGYNLHGTGGYSVTIWMRLAASCMKSRQFFARMLREQLFELKLRRQ
jgi:hypothetical protein